MLHYFRINDPYRLIGLLVVLLLLYLPFLIDLPLPTFPELKTFLVGEKVRSGSSLYTELIDSTAPFTGWTSAPINFLFGESLLGRHIFAFVILFMEAMMLGVIFIDKKVFPESSFIPSLIFGILCAFSFDTLALSGELFGTFFLIFALNSLYKEIEFREENFEMVLRTALFIGLASLFEFSFSLYILAALVIFVLYSRTTGRKILLLFVGYALPHLFLVSVYFIKGGVEELWRYFYLPNLGFEGDRFVAHSDLLLLLALPGFFFLASLVVLNRESRFTKYQSQILQAMFFWTVFSILQVYYSKALRPHSFIPLMIGLSFFISHFFLIIMRRRFAELTFWIFLAAIVSMSLAARYGSINPVFYQDLMVNQKPLPKLQGKHLVVLSDSLAVYQGTTMTTPFLDWSLSEEIFRHPEYYENVSKVYDGFINERPEVIIDPEDLMKPFLERIPALRKSYSKSPEGYRKISG